MHPPQLETEGLRLAFSIDSSKVSAAAFEPATDSKKARLHGFASRAATLMGQTGPQSLRLASDVIIELTENVESQTGEHFSNTVISVASPNLKLGGSSVRLALDDGPISLKQLDQLAKLWPVTNQSKDSQQTFFKLRSRYLIDQVSWSSDPVGLHAELLSQTEVNFSEKRTFLLNMIEAFRICGLGVRNIIPQPYANLLACTTPHERQQGIMVIDIGQQICQMIACRNHLIKGAAIYPVGSERITEDLSICLKVDPNTAEQIKRTTLMNSPLTDSENRNLASDIIQARVKEIVGHLRNLAQTRLTKRDYVAGIVLCGGGSKITGLSNEIRTKIHPIARVVHGYGLEGLSDVLDEPSMASIVGTIIADSSPDVTSINELPEFSAKSKSSRVQKIQTKLKQLFTR